MNYQHLFIAILFTLVSCQKEEVVETTAEEVEHKTPARVKRQTDYIALLTEAMAHPAFPKVEKHPEVMNAKSGHNEVIQEFNQTKNSHPKIQPLLSQLAKLPPASPERIDIGVKMQKIIKEDSALQALIKKSEKTVDALIAAYAVGFQTVEGGQELGEKFRKLAEQ